QPQPLQFSTRFASAAYPCCFCLHITSAHILLVVSIDNHNVASLLTELITQIAQCHILGSATLASLCIVSHV
ncbi:hypothetical protein BKA62DRAFT_659816, partial [Auriculariales sp. MPI-PUGE-AT-0066]